MTATITSTSNTTNHTNTPQTKTEIEAQIKALNEQLKSLPKPVPPKVEWTITQILPATRGLEKALGGIRFIQTIQNFPEIEAFHDTHGVYPTISLPAKKEHYSLTYTWHNGQIYSSGSGYCLTREKYGEGFPCTAEQWEAIKLGNIPAELQHKAL